MNIFRLSLLCLTVTACLQLASLGHAAELQPTHREVPPDGGGVNLVEMFAAIEDGSIGVKFIPQNAAAASVLSVWRVMILPS